MKRNKLYIPLLAFAVMVLSASCGDTTGCKINGQNNVCLLDISGSASKSLGMWITDMQRQLLAPMGPTDVLTVLAIDKASETAAMPLFTLDMNGRTFENPAYPVTIRSRMAAEARVHFMDSVATAFATALKAAVESRKAHDKYTDILGSIRQASQFGRPCYTNRLILLSDMINESEELNMAALLMRGADLDESLSGSHGAKLPFESVLVFTGDNAAISGVQFRAVKAFWEGYFQRNGIPVDAYTSGGIREELVRGGWNDSR